MPEEPRGAVARPQAAAEPRPDSTARPTELGRRSEMLRGLPYEEQQKALEPAGSATPTLSEEELIAWFDHELGFDTPSNVSNSLDRISRLAPATLRSVWARVQPSTRQSFRDNLEERHLLERPKECQAVLQTIDLAHRVEEAIELIGESDTFSWRLAHAMSRDFTGGDLDRYGQVVEERAAAPDGQSIVAVAGGARPSPGRSADVLGYAGAKVGPADALGAYLAFRGLLGPGEQTHELKDLHAAGSALVPELGQAVKLQTGLGWVDGIRARARLADDKAVQLQVHADSASFPEAYYFDASRTPKKRALSFGMTGLELSVAERPVDALHDMDAGSAPR